MFQTYSVKGFFEAMAPLSHPTLTLAHRFVESQAGLAYYAKRPDGLMWRRKELFDAPICYLAFHGRPGTLVSPLGRIGAEPVIEAFADYGRGYRNLAYFACCNVLRGEKGRRFARDFLGRSLLFLHRFYRDPAPWRNLRRIFNSVLRDYPAARRLGYTLVLGSSSAMTRSAAASKRGGSL